MKSITDIKLDVLMEFYSLIDTRLIEIINNHHFFYLGRYYSVYTEDEHIKERNNSTTNIYLDKKFFENDVIIKLKFEDTYEYRGILFYIYVQH